MKFASLLTLAVVAGSTLAQAAEPRFNWAVRAGGPKNDKTRGLCVDAAGNVYMTGEFFGDADFGGQKLTSRGDYDFFVAKYDASGKCLWVRQGGGAKADRGYGVAVDAQGNVYATGHFQSVDATFDSVAAQNTGDYDVFTVKYDAGGKLQWVRTGGGSGYDYGHGIGVDSRGGVYVCAGLVKDVAFDGKTFKSVNGRPGVIKYDAAGKLQWLTQSEGKGGGSGGSIAVDAAGNSWTCGGYSGEMDFAGHKVASPGQRNIFVVKLDPAGKPLWASTSTGKTDGGAAAIGVDQAGRAYIGGMFKGSTAIGSESFTSVDKHDIFVAALDEKGQWLWARHAGGQDTDYALGLAADPAGGCYVTGEVTKTAEFPGGKRVTADTGRDLYLAHFTAQGKLADLVQSAGKGGDFCYTVALHEKSDSIYLSGAFSGTTQYGNATLTSTGANDIMLVQLKR